MYSKIYNLPTHLSPSLQPSSPSPACFSYMHKGWLSTTRLTPNSITIRIFTTWCHITYSLSWSHKPFVFIPVRICIWSFQSVCGTCFWSGQFFHFCLLLLLFCNSHFIGSSHFRVYDTKINYTNNNIPIILTT